MNELPTDPLKFIIMSTDKDFVLKFCKKMLFINEKQYQVNIDRFLQIFGAPF